MAGCDALNPHITNLKQIKIMATYNLTESTNSLLELAKELNIKKIGILDDEQDWTYISDKSNHGESPRFSYDTGIWGEESEPCMNNVKVSELKSESHYDNGKIISHKIIKILGYTEE